MIKINLLATERRETRKRVPLKLGEKGQPLTFACGLILVAGALLVGWRYWQLGEESRQLDIDIAAAEQETQRLHSVIEQVQQFEQRRAQLQQRVALIEQLRRDQTGPVHMLDQISRALPPMLWLTDLRQSADDPTVVTIDGRCTTLTGLSDFVANLEATGYFKRSVEIVSSQLESAQQGATELIRFSLRAQFQQPSDAAPAVQPSAQPASTPDPAPVAAAGTNG